MVCFGLSAFLELYLCLFLFLMGCSKYKTWKKRILKHLCLLISNQISYFNLCDCLLVSYLLGIHPPLISELDKILTFGMVFLIFKVVNMFISYRINFLIRYQY